jgi:hypothetical protein
MHGAIALLFIVSCRSGDACVVRKHAKYNLLIALRANKTRVGLPVAFDCKDALCLGSVTHTIIQQWTGIVLAVSYIVMASHRAILY